MKKQKPQTEALRKLREQAEALAQTKREDILDLSPEEIRRVVHDLHTHQIELEIQNEQLRATQEELQGSQERLTDLYDFAPVGYITVSEDGSILEANLTAAQMLNRDRTLLLSQPFSAFIVDDDQDVYYLHRRALAQDENRQTCELRVRREDDLFWVALESARIAGDDGDGFATRHALSDISARKQVEEEREFLIGELEAKNTELERFVYTISHELKSPLVTIAGFSGMLLDDLGAGDNIKVTEDVQRVSSAVDTMSIMLDELLELSRIGRVIHTPEEVDFGDLTYEILKSIKSQAVELDIKFETASDLPVFSGDRSRLREAVRNIIENAIKFRDNQSKLHVKIGSRKQATETIFYVQDNGKGIDPKYHDKVFGLFERLDPTINGTGIGLTLVHRIIEEHGGRVWVESEGVGKGSCFCLALPQHEGK